MECSLSTTTINSIRTAEGSTNSNTDTADYLTRIKRECKILKTELKLKKRIFDMKKVELKTIEEELKIRKALNELESLGKDNTAAICASFTTIEGSNTIGKATHLVDLYSSPERPTVAPAKRLLRSSARIAGESTIIKNSEGDDISTDQTTQQSTVPRIQTPKVIKSKSKPKPKPKPRQNTQTKDRRTSILSEPETLVCTNCKTTESSSWRRSQTGQRICNACQIYQRTYGKLRVVSLLRNKVLKGEKAINVGKTAAVAVVPPPAAKAETRAKVKPKEPAECTNCHATQTSSWRRSNSGARLCNACKIYEKAYGRPRVIHLLKSKRECGKMANLKSEWIHRSDKKDDDDDDDKEKAERVNGGWTKAKICEAVLNGMEGE